MPETEVPGIAGALAGAAVVARRAHRRLSWCRAAPRRTTKGQPRGLLPRRLCPEMRLQPLRMTLAAAATATGKGPTMTTGTAEMAMAPAVMKETNGAMRGKRKSAACDDGAGVLRMTTRTTMMKTRGDNNAKVVSTNKWFPACDCEAVLLRMIGGHRFECNRPNSNSMFNKSACFRLSYIY